MTLPFRSDTEIDAAIPVVKEHLARGGLLAYPTETVYGLGSGPKVPALDALARLKGRAPDKPFLLLVSSRAMVEEWGLVLTPAARALLLLVSSRAMVEEWGLVLTPAARALAAAFWPGPLTLVLPGGEGKLPDQLRGREGGIAVRYTSHTGIARLVAATGEPLTSTSANRPGDPPAPGADRIRVVFAEEVALGELLVLDGGVLGNVPPSTLVDCTSPVPRLVREGAIPRTELRRAAGRLAP